MYNRWQIFAVVIICGFLIFGGCTSTTSSPAGSADTGTPTPSQSVQLQEQSLELSRTFTLTVDSLTPGSVLPDAYTCKGAGESPAVTWEGIPTGTKSLVLILDDPDAPNGRFTHWIVYNIPPEFGVLTQAQPNAKVLANGAQQGETSAGSRGYYAPCPPIGASHRYVFTMYAVDMDITQPTADRESIDWALTGHTIAKTEFTSTFKR
ncbi:MAG: YbhB/YbcL family Raf kinase inhibitor-like protein [Methanoregula sp.]|nr:YbhB/YbcL family Raf kinase inhibitor-like protein [Methanoregula sp.]